MARLPDGLPTAQRDQVVHGENGLGSSEAAPGKAVRLSGLAGSALTDVIVR